MKQKLLIFVGSISRGGTEHVVCNIANYYARNKQWDVVIVMVLHSFCEYELDSNIQLVDVHSEKGIRSDFLSVIRRMRSVLSSENPDVVLSFTAQVSLLVSMALGRSKYRLIMSERNDPAHVFKSRFSFSLLKRAYSRADCVVFQTERIKNMFPDRVKSGSVIVPNPIEVKAYRTSATNHTIVSVGRLSEQKNHQLLISAFNEIHKLHPEYSLEIYGKGVLENRLLKQINELGLEDCVSLMGSTLELHKRISTAEIFVLPSNYEGLSNALLEAMAMGFPVISTDCAGSDEVIADGENGLLIPVGDKKALVEAMERLINDRELAERLGKNAMGCAERFKIENVVGEWEAVIEGKK